MDESAHTTSPSAVDERAAGSPRLLALIALVLVVVVLAGVAITRGGDGIDLGSSSSAVDSGDPRPLPEFTAELRDGGSFESSDIEGPAMIQVFASWCPSCQAHAPLVAQVQEEFSDLSTYYVNVADDAGGAAEFLDEHDWADSPVLVDDDRSIAGAFGVTGQPHTIFVDADGNVTDVLEGGGELAALQAAAERVTVA